MAEDVSSDELHRRLRESEELRRIALRSGGMGAWRWDRRARSVQADDAFQDLWGVSFADRWHPVSAYTDRMAPEGVAALDALVTRACEAGEEFNDQVLIARGPRAGRWVQWRGRAEDDRPWIINGVSFDITAQKLAEQELRESEQRYRTLFESMDEAYAVVEVIRGEAGEPADFRFLEVNSAFMAHTGTACAIGGTASAFLKTPAPRWAALCGQALDTGTPLRVQEPEESLGRIFDLNIFCLDRDRNRVAMLFTDITERTQAEAALRESERRHKALLSASNQVLYTHSPDWSEMRQLIGGGFLSDTQSPDPNWFDVYIHPDDQPHVWATIQTAIASKSVFELEHRVLQADGRLGWTSSRSIPLLDEEGRIVEWFGAASDVTPRREAEAALTAAEERQRALIEGIPQLVWRAAPNGAWSWASPQWQVFTGQRSEESAGFGWVDALHPDDRDQARRLWLNAEECGRLDLEGRILSVEEDRYRWFQTRATPVRDADGAIVEWLGTSTDVDDLRSMQERQQILVHELQHRTRNLIAVIDGIARQTLEHTGPTKLFIDQFNNRLVALARVQDLLARSDERRITIHDIVHLELDALGADLADGRVRVAGPAIGLRRGVVQTIALAMHELATNARKYGALASDRGSLSVTWGLVEQEGRTWLSLVWAEVGPDPGPEAARGGLRFGYGRELIEEALPFALGARTAYRFDGGGIHCTITLPLDQVGKENPEGDTA